MSAIDTIGPECKEGLRFAHDQFLLLSGTKPSSDKSVISIFFIFLCSLFNRSHKARSRFLSTLVVWGFEHKPSCMHTNHVNCIHVEFLLNQHPYNVYLLSAFNTSFTDGFLCKSIGHFPDQNDCRRFYGCYTWIIGKDAIQYTCPSNAPFFHAKDEECRNITSGGMVYYNIT